MKMKYHTLFNVVILIISWIHLSVSITIIENRNGFEQININESENNKNIDINGNQYGNGIGNENENLNNIGNANEFPSINNNKNENLFMEIGYQIDSVKNFTM